MFFIKRISIVIFSFICCLINSNASACDQQPKSKPWVILLNGTSSAGKSTITKEFVKEYPELKPVIIKFDDLLEEALFKEMQQKIQQLGINATTREEMQNKLSSSKRAECYQAVADQQRAIKKKMRDGVVASLKQGKNVIIDTVIGDDDYENTKEWFETLNTLSNTFPVFCALVYCPLKLLVSRVVSRNSMNTLKEQRNLQNVIELFGSMYTSQKSTTLCAYDYYFGGDSCPCIDTITKDDVQKVIASCNSISNAQQVIKTTIKQINLSWDGSSDMPLYPKFAYNIILKNSGNKTPSSLAKALYDSLQEFLNKPCSQALQSNEKVARIAYSGSLGR